MMRRGQALLAGKEALLVEQNSRIELCILLLRTATHGGSICRVSQKVLEVEIC